MVYPRTHQGKERYWSPFPWDGFPLGLSRYPGYSLGTGGGQVRSDGGFKGKTLFLRHNRIVDVSPCHLQARTGVVVLIQTYEQRTPPTVVQGAAPDSEWPRIKADRSE